MKPRVRAAGERKRAPPARKRAVPATKRAPTARSSLQKSFWWRALKNLSMAAANLCGFKIYTTFSKLSKTPGFPLSINGKFRRAELERWLQMNGAAK